MGVLRRLLGLGRVPHDEPPSHDAHIAWSQLDDRVRLTVVGESFRQEALARVSGAPPHGPHQHECAACLVPEPTNPHDRFAVRVEIDGEHVGYLPRGTARRFQRRLVELIDREGPVTCRAFVGRQDGENPNLGVALWLPHDHALFTA